MLPWYTESASPLLSQYSDSQGIHTVTKIYQNNPAVTKPFWFKIRLNYFSINSQHFLCAYTIQDIMRDFKLMQQLLCYPCYGKVLEGFHVTSLNCSIYVQLAKQLCQTEFVGLAQWCRKPRGKNQIELQVPYPVFSQPTRLKKKEWFISCAWLAEKSPFFLQLLFGPLVIKPC